MSIEKANNKCGVTFSYIIFVPPVFGFRQKLSCCRIKLIKGLWLSGSLTKDFERSEATILKSFIRSSLSLPFALVSNFKVLSGQKLVWMLRVRIRIIVLILRNVILLKLHVLLSTR
jgi:hypothetical protein